jgi:hypothetical protein
MKTLPRHLGLMLIDAVKTCGSYKPQYCLSHIEESLTGDEYEELTQFLNWLTANKLTFGHNVEEVFAKWKASQTAAHVELVTGKGATVQLMPGYQLVSIAEYDRLKECQSALRALLKHCSMIHNKWGEDCNQKQADAAIAAAKAAIR